MKGILDKFKLFITLTFSSVAARTVYVDAEEHQDGELDDLHTIMDGREQVTFAELLAYDSSKTGIVVPHAVASALHETMVAEKVTPEHVFFRIEA